MINNTQVNGNIAVAVRGTCNFSQKALNAQNAGATALIIINNLGTSPMALGAGTGSGSITIPVIMISQVDGANLLSALSNNEPSTGLLGVQKEWIESFTLNGVTTTSGDNNGYLGIDGTNALTLGQGQSYNFSLTPGFSNQSLPEYTRVWLDANQDGTFGAGELIYDQGSSSFGVLNASLTIPASSSLGNTRMRVQLAYQGEGQTTLPSNCGDFIWGEVEDYCVMIDESTTGVEEVISFKDAIKVYPNPSSNKIYFENKKLAGQSKINITNMVGKTITSIDFKADHVVLDVSSLPSGTYFYAVVDTSGKLLITDKLVVVK